MEVTLPRAKQVPSTRSPAKFKYLNNLNFLLDPGSIPIGEVVFKGQVVGDLNGDGIQDAEDVGVFNFLVFADLNHTGQFELGESFTYTDSTATMSSSCPQALRTRSPSPSRRPRLDSHVAGNRRHQ